jgi:homoserine kinase
MADARDDALRDDVLGAVQVPATSANLGPGFDALGVALGLHLRVGAVARGPVRVATCGEGAGEVPDGDDNLVWASLVRFCETVGVDVPDVSLEVRNDIPLERGLGSSSAAIVGGLALGRLLTGAVVGDRRLVALADEIEGHPDNVAPAILGGFVSATTGADGHLVVRRAQPDPSTVVLVAVPQQRQLTSEARAALPATLPREDVVTQAARAAHVAGALTGTWPIDPLASGDVLHEPGRFEVMGDSGRVARAWREVGLHAWLSGAGPAIAAAVPRVAGAARQRATALATDAGFATHLLDWDLAGIVACAPGRCAISGTEGCPTCPRRGLC